MYPLLKYKKNLKYLKHQKSKYRQLELSITVIEVAFLQSTWNRIHGTAFPNCLAWLSYRRKLYLEPFVEDKCDTAKTYVCFEQSFSFFWYICYQ